jgi:hypothetical protein
MIFLYPKKYVYLYLYAKALAIQYAGNQQNSSNLQIKEVFKWLQLQDSMKM